MFYVMKLRPLKFLFVAYSMKMHSLIPCRMAKYFLQMCNWQSNGIYLFPHPKLNKRTENCANKGELNVTRFWSMYSSAKRAFNTSNPPDLNIYMCKSSGVQMYGF